jgi:hypothetical protein
MCQNHVSPSIGTPPFFALLYRFSCHFHSEFHALLELNSSSSKYFSKLGTLIHSLFASFKVFVLRTTPKQLAPIHQKYFSKMVEEISFFGIKNRMKVFCKFVLKKHVLTYTVTTEKLGSFLRCGNSWVFEEKSWNCGIESELRKRISQV